MNFDKKIYLNMAEKMLRNVSDLMLASVSHYEILEGERFGPKFAPIRTAVVVFFFVGEGVLVNTAQLICLFVQGLFKKKKNSQGSLLKTS